VKELVSDQDLSVDIEALSDIPTLGNCPDRTLSKASQDTSLGTLAMGG
jgi:hypothetical protein